MHDRVGVAGAAKDRSRIHDGAVDHLGLWAHPTEVIASAGREVVQDADGEIFGGEGPDQTRADEPCAAGDENAVHEAKAYPACRRILAGPPARCEPAAVFGDRLDGTTLFDGRPHTRPLRLSHPGHRSC